MIYQRKYRYVLMYVLCIFHLHSQTSGSDSLKRLLKASKQDTNTVNILNYLCSELTDLKPGEAKVYALQSIKLSQRLFTQTQDKIIHASLNKALAKSCNNLANIYESEGDHSAALYYYNNALVLNNAANRKKWITINLNNIARVYQYQADYTKMLDYYEKALVLNKEIGDKNLIAESFTNIGTAYYYQSKYEKALSSYLESAKLFERVGNKSQIADAYNSIGNIYYRLHDNTRALDFYNQALSVNNEDLYYIGKSYAGIAGVYEKTNKKKSLEYQFKALANWEKLNEKTQLAATYGNIGDTYCELDNMEKAIEFHEKGMKLREEINDKWGMIYSLNGVAIIYMKLEQYSKAIEHLKKSVELAKEIGATAELSEALRLLAKTSSLNNDFKNAYDYHVKFFQLHDSVYSKESAGQVAEMQTKYNVEKKEKELVLRNTEIEQQNSFRKFLYALSAVLLVLAIVLLMAFRNKRKSNIILESQKNEIELQKFLLQDKNTSITESIRYAQRIQEALLVPEEEIKAGFSDAFVLFKPKDIVSGDFYWYAESSQNKIVAVADCTGHGVPGGFMSMLGYEMLQEILLLENVETTAKALKILDTKVTETLNKNNRSYRDGMDMVLCAFNRSTGNLQYSGANRPLVYIRNGELNIIKPDKHTIGGSIDEVSKSFNNVELQMRPGDVIYLFTDGYVDQFGGPAGKKLKFSRLTELFLEIHQLPLMDQKQKLDDTFTAWKGELEQVDDVCIIGIKI